MGIFNPRYKTAACIRVNQIPTDIIDAVEHDVIGYGWTREEYMAFQKQEFRKLSDQIKKTTVTRSIQSETKNGDIIKKDAPPKVGDILTHSKFGRGIVKEVIITKRSTEVYIKLDSGETKEFWWEFAAQFFKYKTPLLNDPKRRRP